MTATPARELQPALTKEDLAEWVHQRMEANGGDKMKAIRGVVDEMLSNGEAEWFVRSLGFDAVRYLVGERERRGQRAEAPSPSGQNPSRFASLEDGKTNPLNLYATVANQDTPKRLGEWTDADWREDARYTRKHGRTLLAKADRREKLAETIPDGKTTADVWDDLPDDLRDAVREKAA